MVDDFPHWDKDDFSDCPGEPSFGCIYPGSCIALEPHYTSECMTAEDAAEQAAAEEIEELRAALSGLLRCLDHVTHGDRQWIQMRPLGELNPTRDLDAYQRAERALSSH